MANLLVSLFGHTNRPFSDASIRAGKLSATPRKLSDGGGLQRHIMPAGSKLWRLAYRFQGKQKLLVLGKYPIVSLAQAREARDHARAQVAQGHDPSVVRKQGADASAADASCRFDVVGRAWRGAIELAKQGEVQTALTAGELPDCLKALMACDESPGRGT